LEAAVAESSRPAEEAIETRHQRKLSLRMCAQGWRKCGSH
jgi:hypothetical protein